MKIIMDFPVIESTFKFIQNQKKSSNVLLLIFLLNNLIASIAYAHRSAEDSIDDCRIRVGFEAVHFTAYTPSLSGATEYCNNIPGLGPTNIVFDYEGKKLRNITVEFEITKEPEGKRIFYQEPKKIKTGNFNGQIDFSKYGKGDYLAHVTIVHKDQRLDTHLPFRVGFEEKSYSRYIPLVLASIILIIVIGSMVFKSKSIPNK